VFRCNISYDIQCPVGACYYINVWYGYVKIFIIFGLLCLTVGKKIFDMGVVRCFCFGLQKYEKSSIDRVIEVLHSAAVAREEIEHQCAALESTPTLTEFTDAMIEGRSMRRCPHLF